MNKDDNIMQMEDLKWVRNSIIKMLPSMICPNGHLAHVYIEHFPDSGKACDAIFKCKQCGKTFSYNETIKIITSGFALSSKLINDLSIPLFVQCPSCNEITYDTSEHVCYLCQNEKQLVCTICGKNIDIEDIPCWTKNQKCKTCNCHSQISNEEK